MQRFRTLIAVLAVTGLLAAGCTDRHHRACEKSTRAFLNHLVAYAAIEENQDDPAELKILTDYHGDQAMYWSAQMEDKCAGYDEDKLTEMTTRISNEILHSGLTPTDR